MTHPFKAGDTVKVNSKEHFNHYARLGRTYAVIRTAGGLVVIKVPLSLLTRTANEHERAQGYSIQNLDPRDVSAKTPAPDATKARWFVIDLTKEALVALRLEDRAAGVQWIKSFGNLSHQYVVAKETGEFKVSREVAEV